MNRKIIWALVALVLIAAPAVLGVVVLGDDDGRRSAALIQAGPAGGLGGQLTIDALTPLGQAIEVQSWSWGVTADATTATGTLSTAKAQVSDLQITKTIDASTPKLVAAATMGKHYAKAKLTLYRGGEKPVEYYTYELTDVVISGVRQSGSGTEVPMEEVSLAFRAINLLYKHDAASTPVQATYDLTLATKG
jgi:type VI secretion system secreted protein Hcp